LKAPARDQKAAEAKESYLPQGEIRNGNAWLRCRNRRVSYASKGLIQFSKRGKKRRTRKNPGGGREPTVEWYWRMKESQSRKNIGGPGHWTRS